MNTFRSGWYLIYTKPRHEKKVHAYLIEKNITSFLPVEKKLRTWRNRKKYIEEPLFPSYIFVYLTDMRNYYEGIETSGSLYYVRTGKEIARVNEAVVKNIKLATGHGEHLEVSTHSFETGQRLVINQGALTGLSCELIQFENEKKFLVRVDFLQRNILFTLPEEYLIAI